MGAHINVWVQKRPDRATLSLQWFDPETGRRRSKSADTDDPKEAEQRRADLEYELNHGLHSEPNKITWERFRQLFEAEYLPGLRPNTQEKYAAVLDVFEAEMKPTKLAKITERTISRFVQAMRTRKLSGGRKGFSPFSIRNYLVALKTALRWATDQKLMTASPKFPRVKVPKKKPKPIPPETFEKLLKEEKNPLWKAFMCCGWWAGLRLSEAYALRREPSEQYPWIEWNTSRIVFPAEFVKADEDQWVPLHGTLRTILEALPQTGCKVFDFRKSNGAPLTRKGITRHVIMVAQRAGVHLSMHTLRKGFGCRVASMLGKGNAPVLHSLMRHSSMQVSMEYYANVDDVLHEAIGGLK